MKNIKHIILFILLFTSISCGDGFLDKEPLGRPSSTVLFNTPEGIELMLNATYAENRSFPLTAFGWFVTKELGSDDTESGSNAGDGSVPRMRLFSNFQYMSDQLDLANFWAGSYTLIANANLVINNAPNVEFEDTDLQQKLIAEAKFLRAEVYFNLVRGWGGVPILDNVEFDPQKASQVTGRATEAETYAFIENDLEEAIANLPLKSEYPGSELGRATKGAAQSLLAQVYLHQKKIC